MDDILKRFHISKRTFYYDIQSINDEIKRCGQIQNVSQRLSFFGDSTMLQESFHLSETSDFFDPAIRCNYLLLLFLEGRNGQIGEFYHQLGISDNTRVNDLHTIRKFLEKKECRLCAAPAYTVLGDELSIRNLYLSLLENFRRNMKISQSAADFNQKCDLQLTDDALIRLSCFLAFVRNRLSKGLVISERAPFLQAVRFPYYSTLPGLLGTDDKAELNYFASYISSLSSRKMEIRNDFVERYLDTLIDEFEAKTAITLEDREEFKKNIRHHMISLYYRVLFHFSAKTRSEFPDLNMQHEPLYKLVRSIVQECGEKFPEFQNLSNNEIGYLTAYFGGYLSSRKSEEQRRKKVLLVCPHGLTVSKILQFELIRHIPAIEIVDTVAVSQLPQEEKNYDAVISTTELPGWQHVIIVNPILTKADVSKIMCELYGIGTYPFDMRSLMQIIERNTIITNTRRLQSELAEFLDHKTFGEDGNRPALKDLITAERISVVPHVDNWKDGIRLAAQPLLQDHTIEASYIAAMIDSVQQFGPYIVLDDYFALPHAKTNVGVNRLGMALLVVKDGVDVLGHSVNVFLVLAAVDTDSHLKALGMLSDILDERGNIERFRAGDKKEILELIGRY